MNHIKLISALNITPGIKWQGSWDAGKMEGNRRLYDYELVFFSSGNGRVVFPECTFHCSAGSVVIVPPGSVHCTLADTPVHRWCLHFDWHGDWQQQNPGGLPFVYLDSRKHFNAGKTASPPPEALGASFPFFKVLEPDKRRRFHQLIMEYFEDGGDSAASFLNRKGILLQLLSILLATAAAAPSGQNNRHFMRAKSFLDENYTNPSIGLKAAAAAANITPNHLSKIFHQACGRPVLQYLLELRLAEARRLLTTTQLNIGEIALRTGFSDPNYFTRYFRRQTGITPGKYRNGDSL